MGEKEEEVEEEELEEEVEVEMKIGSNFCQNVLLYTSNVLMLLYQLCECTKLLILS